MSVWPALTDEEQRQIKQVAPDLPDRLIGMEGEKGIYIRRKDWDGPIAADDAEQMAFTAQPVAGTTTVTTFLAQPDVPRQLVLTGSQGTCAGTAVLTGTDGEDNVIAENIVINGVAAVPTVYAYKRVTSLVIPARVAGGDTVKLGTTDGLGLGYLLRRNSVIMANFNGVREATLPTMTCDSAIYGKNLCNPNSACDGSAIQVWFFEERN